MTSTEDWDCEYYEYSTVPDQTGGPFWSVLNRLFICTSIPPLFPSQLTTSVRMYSPSTIRNWGPKIIIRKILTYPRSRTWIRLFRCIPSFVSPSSNISEGIWLKGKRIATQMLSHYCDLFPQATSWLLFIIGCFNIIAGLVFRQKSKTKRLIFSWEIVPSL
jgi:hypothetical protein